MQLFIFKLKLFFYLVGFLFNLAFGQVKKAKPFFLVLFFLLFISSLVFMYYLKNKIKNEDIKSNSDYSPTRPDLYLKSEKTKSQIQGEIIFWETIIEKQPKSRDALINLSVLKRLQGENEEAEKLWNKAELIDPNNPVF